MLEDYINKLRPIILELFKGESSGHDIGHLERTMNTNTARELAKNRTDFMKKFVEEFLKEWKANY